MFKKFLLLLLIVFLPVTAHAIDYKGGLETTESVIFPEQSTTPTGNPSATKYKLYIKNDGNPYVLDSAGTEEAVTSQANIIDGLESGSIPVVGPGTGFSNGMEINFDYSGGTDNVTVFNGLLIGGGVTADGYSHTNGILVYIADLVDTWTTPFYNGVEGRVDMDVDGSILGGQSPFATGVLGYVTLDAVDNTSTTAIGVEGRVTVGPDGATPGTGTALGVLGIASGGAFNINAKFGDGATSGDNAPTQFSGYNTGSSTSATGYIQIDDHASLPANREMAIGTDDTNLSGIAIRLPEAAGASSLKVRDSAGALVFDVNSDGDAELQSAQVAMGSAPTALASVGGTLHSDTVAVATDADTTEKDLLTYTLPANSLSADGKGVRIGFGVSTSANTDNKTIKIYFGSTVIYTVSSTTAFFSAIGEILVVRRGVSSQIYYTPSIGYQTDLGILVVPVFSTTEDETTSNVIKVTGQNGVATAGDITAEHLIVTAVE